MPPRKRMILALAAAGVLALPAGVLAGLCLGKACDRPDRSSGPVPFCSLPAELRSSIANGFRDARSPHIMAVAGEEGLETTSGSGAWPSLDQTRAPRVPLVFAGTGIASGAEIPPGTKLDAVAPTLAELISLNRPHPGVRSGEALAGLASGGSPRLVVLVALKDVTSGELERRPRLWPVLRGLMEDGAATLEADPGSLPADPAAILTTLGTGALPKDHGITGSLVRNEEGDVVEPWAKGSPFSVVAALSDDLDELTDQVARVGLIGTDPSDRGLIGGNWYIEHDEDEVLIERKAELQAGIANDLMVSGYGDDDVADLLGIVMEGRLSDLDTALGSILESARAVSGDSFAMAVTSTGSRASDRSGDVSLSDIDDQVELTLGTDAIEASTPGGFFLDQDAMREAGLTDDRVVSALRRIETSSGDPLFADVFPSIAVTFSRFC